ncbi:hypothetical protein F4861DRAFT_194644 [Xylaria intraflava]|nr:hypothetical protein F4861DRAFT_194644 [Xylaria intraflava]
MRNPKGTFLRFWVWILRFLNEERLEKSFGVIGECLREVLNGPFASGYTARFLAYKVVLAAIKQACDLDISDIRHPNVSFEPHPDDHPVDVWTLRAMAGKNGLSVLVDILDEGRCTDNRKDIAESLGIEFELDLDIPMLPEEQPRSPRDSSSSFSRYFLFIPALINLERHLQPDLYLLEEKFRMKLTLNLESRMLSGRPKSDFSTSKAHEIFDRNFCELCHAMLYWSRCCTDRQQSISFVFFYTDSYKRVLQTALNKLQPIR